MSTSQRSISTSHGGTSRAGTNDAASRDLAGSLQRRLVGLAVGPLGAVVVAWSLSLDADRDGLTQANVALVMAAATVLVASFDWLAGAVTSVAAALALNYFHTEPYRTLRVTDRRDVYSIVVLGALGLVVSAVTARRVRRRVLELRRADAHRSGAALAALVASDRPVSDVWAASVSASSNDLAMVSARVVARVPDGLAEIGRLADRAESRTITLPTQGAALHLSRRHHEGRWLVLTPLPGLGPVEVDRRAVLAFADALEVALDPNEPDDAFDDGPDGPLDGPLEYPYDDPYDDGLDDPLDDEFDDGRRSGLKDAVQ